MTDEKKRSGAAALPETHPRRGPAEFAGDPSKAAFEIARVKTGGKQVTAAFEKNLAAEFTRIGEDPGELLSEAFAVAPDSGKLSDELGEAEIRFRLFERSMHAFEPHEPGREIGINRAVFEIQDRLIRRIILQTGLIHQLRHAAETPGGVRESEPNLSKKDAGLFLLLLVKHSRKLFFLPVILSAVDGIFDPGSGFRDLLASFLERLPFVRREDPSESPFGRPFFHGKAFDDLGFADKVRAIAGGVLAWYSTLSLGLLSVLDPLLDRATPFYRPARLILKASSQEGFLLKRGFIRRAARAMFVKRRPHEAVEFFWSGWNPVLARVAVRPAFRLFGGNSRPLFATVATFVYTAVVVHLMGPLAVALLAMRLIHEFGGGFRLGAFLGSDLNFKIIAGAVSAYAFFGVLSGLSKVMRKRRARTGRKGD